MALKSEFCFTTKIWDLRTHGNSCALLLMGKSTSKTYLNLEKKIYVFLGKKKIKAAWVCFLATEPYQKAT